MLQHNPSELELAASAAEVQARLAEELARVLARKKELEQLSQTLARSIDPQKRRGAAAALGGYGEAAVEPLCTALVDSAREVRLAAIRALGAVGSLRAVEPLTGMLHRTLGGRTAHQQRWIGVAVVSALVCLVLGLIFGSVALKTGGVFVVWFNVINMFIQRRRDRHLECGPIAEALASIAERNPTPQLRSLLPDLQALAADGIQQSAETRRASRQALQRIETLTGQFKDLPVVGAAPESDAKNLPLPADHEPADRAEAPRPSSPT